jgi:hypothetical protein
MNRFLPYYYLLFVLLITGAFASMAQNVYGQTILGIVTAAFTLLFSFQLVTIWDRRDKTWQETAELCGLIILSTIMTLRIFYIYFKGVELIFVLAAGAILLIYIYKLIHIMISPGDGNIKLKGLIFIFYLSLVIYLFAMITVQFFPSLSTGAGYIAFSLLALFMIGSLLLNRILVNGENITPFQIVSRSRDKSVLLISLFFIFSLYMGFTSLGLLPKMYSNEYPQAYYKLLSNSGKKEMSSAELRKKQEEFKIRYDALVKKHLKNMQ